jgi:hypothetical protein
MIDIVLRCFSRARWLTVAQNRNILDADGNPNPGFAVDEIGPVTLTYKGRSIRAYQVFSTSNRIQVIDPRDYGEVRVREWLGGQSF